MKNFKILFIALLGTSLFLTSCQDDCKDVVCNDNGTCIEGLCECDEGYSGSDCLTSIPFIEGTEVTLTSTIQSPGLTSGAIVDIETQFGQPAGSGTATATLGAAIEFEDYAYGLWDIDMTSSQISFELVGENTNTVWSNLIGAPLFPDTFLRYNFSMDKSFRVSQYSNSNASVTDFINVSYDNANNILNVEISEGYPFATGNTFTLSFE